MNTCGSCKFKGEQIDTEWAANPAPTSFFLCTRIANQNKQQCDIMAADTGQKAIVIDGSGYFAALCVEEDFGCALWEAA